MTPEMCKQFRESLVQRRKELADNSQLLIRVLQTAELQQGIGSGREEGDFAVMNHIEHLSGKRFTYQMRLIREIDSALRRIEEGSFGCCDECGDDIHPARLRVMPFAKLCLDCQEVRERTLVCA